MLLCLGAFALALPMGLTAGIAALAMTTVALQLMFAAVAHKAIVDFAGGSEPTTMAGASS
jgi:hypothetical protein